MKNVSFNRDVTIFREGEEGHSMYIIRSGRVALRRGYGKAGEKKLTELGAGDAFGVMSVLEPVARPVTAVAVEDGTELREIGAEEFDAYLRENPETMKHLLTQMSRQIRALTAGHVDVYEAVADYQPEPSAPEQSEELRGRIQKIVSIYQNRYPTLFNLSVKEAKDDVRFVFDASAKKTDSHTANSAQKR